MTARGRSNFELKHRLQASFLVETLRAGLFKVPWNDQRLPYPSPLDSRLYLVRQTLEILEHAASKHVLPIISTGWQSIDFLLKGLVMLPVP